MTNSLLCGINAVLQPGFSGFVWHPPQCSHVGDGGGAGLHAGRRRGAALAVQGRVVLERGAHGRVAFGEASEVGGQRAAGGHVLRRAHLLRELQHCVLLLRGETEVLVQTAHGQQLPGRCSNSLFHQLGVKKPPHQTSCSLINKINHK